MKEIIKMKKVNEIEYKEYNRNQTKPQVLRKD